MITSNKFKPSVHTELEEWDDTSDSIVWLIEQNADYHLSCPKLELDEAPQQYHGSRRFETPQSQKATLTGYTKEHHKATFIFYTDFTQIKVPTPEDPTAEVDGYQIVVEKENSQTYKKESFAKYTVKGYDRKSFEVF